MVRQEVVSVRSCYESNISLVDANPSNLSLCDAYLAMRVLDDRIRDDKVWRYYYKNSDHFWRRTEYELGEQSFT